MPQRLEFLPRARRAVAAAGMLAAVLLAGCATTPPPAARLGLKLAPQALGESISVQQHLRVERKGRSDELDVALEVDAAHIELVGLALGQRVLSLSYDGKEMKTWRHLMLPAQVKAEDVLEDVQLTLWPAEALRAALPAGWQIEERAQRRTLSLNGETIMRIEYSAPQRWLGTVVLENLRYHYRLTIESAPAEEGQP
ncbi:DUF3261 domain-containing protein [Pseudoduganella violacea]|uniref:DUF3261 domain-containing protein n=1 Tax=Pseudoduganella violacea TaxID=1715466 RepID=A0A7W5B993_9BURK|nr:DUF3261 domain-containing protein [Pseudoduganella violacea]MBB3118902.1 hypothetical protein [Pseudoduganella violacea]